MYSNQHVEIKPHIFSLLLDLLNEMTVMTKSVYSSLILAPIGSRFASEQGYHDKQCDVYVRGKICLKFFLLLTG